MAFDFSMGDIHKGHYPENGGEVALENMYVMLRNANEKYKDWDYKKGVLSLLRNNIKRYEGRSGIKVTEETYNMLFEDYGENTAPIPYKEQYSEWTLTAQKYQARNWAFTTDWWEDMERYGKNPGEALIDKVAAVTNKYENVFLPNIVMQAMYYVPKDGGEFTEDFGALRNVEIPESMMVRVNPNAAAGERGSVIRNNFRAIVDNSGVQMSDLKDLAAYVDDIQDINPGNLIGIVNTYTRNHLSEVFADTMSQDKFDAELGTEVFKVGPFRFVEVKEGLDNIITFIAVEQGRPLIAELTNPNPNYKGLRLKSEITNPKFELPEDLVNNKGTKFIIEDIGLHWIGRQYLYFLDIDPTRASADGLMQQGGFDEIKAKSFSLLKQWKRVEE